MGTYSRLGVHSIKCGLCIKTCISCGSCKLSLLRLGVNICTSTTTTHIYLHLKLRQRSKVTKTNIETELGSCHFFFQFTAGSPRKYTGERRRLGHHSGKKAMVRKQKPSSQTRKSKTNIQRQASCLSLSTGEG